MKSRIETKLEDFRRFFKERKTKERPGTFVIPLRTKESRILDVRSERGNNEDSTQQSVSAFSALSGRATSTEGKRRGGEHLLNGCLVWAPKPRD